jgi:hypothetical protein
VRPFFGRYLASETTILGEGSWPDRSISVSAAFQYVSSSAIKVILSGGPSVC